jgi:hypothetical protein
MQLITWCLREINSSWEHEKRIIAISETIASEDASSARINNEVWQTKATDRWEDASPALEFEGSGTETKREGGRVPGARDITLQKMKRNQYWGTWGLRFPPSLAEHRLDVGCNGGVANPQGAGAGSSNFTILTFPDFVSLTGGPRCGGSHLSVTQS